MAVEAPAGHGAVIEHRAGVRVQRLVADDHGGGVRPPGHGRCHWGVAGVGAAVAELAVAVLAPAGHRAVVQDRAGVRVPGGNGDGGAPRGQPDRDRGGA